jgi:imidazolonepropionase-like amidohydrolase
VSVPAALILGLFVTIVPPASLGNDACTAGPYRGTFAFVDVTVIPMDRERTLDRMTVVVRDGCIAAIGPTHETAVPAGAARIDGRGKYLMPGLAEMHAHIPSPRNGAMDYAHEVLFLYVANGITTIRGMLGHPAHLTLREQVARGEVLGPRIWTSGPSVNGQSVSTVAAARRAAIGQKEAGYDFIKIHPGLTHEVFDTLDAVADRVKITFSGHVPIAVGLMRALAAPYASIDHLDGYMDALLPDNVRVDRAAGGFFGANFATYIDESKIPTVVADTRVAGVWNVPTQTLIESYASDERAESRAKRHELRYMPPAVRQNWTDRTAQWMTTAAPDETRRRFIEVRRSLIKALHDGGAGLLLGSDAPQIWNVPGFSIRAELEAMVAAGLTPYQTLVTGTRNVATFFDATEEQGTVTVGKRADLILVDGNPLQDVTHVGDPAGVMVNGKWLSRSEIRARLNGIAAAYEN